MSDKWRDHGFSGDAGNYFPWVPGGTEHVVENTETGEYRTVHVHDDQDVGDAIANGQFTDRDEDD
jgi:hypothetical protein